MENTAFWCGIGAGMVLGAAVGMAVSPRQRSMKTCVGRTMQHMGNAVDNACPLIFNPQRFAIKNPLEYTRSLKIISIFVPHLERCRSG